MPPSSFFSAALLLTSLAGAMAQGASTTANPLNAFIGAAGSAAGVVESANARQSTLAPTSSPTSSQSSPSPAATTSSAPSAKHTGINHTTLIVAIVCAVVAALLLALLVGLCCWCLARRRRRRRNRVHTPIEDEVKSWRTNEPRNPGRQYTPPTKNGGVNNIEQQPMIPATAEVPDMRQHPALRQDNNVNAENPFVPTPPGPRRQAPNSRAGLTDGMIPGADPYIMPEAQKLRKSSSRSRSNSRPRATSQPGSSGLPTGLPTSNTASRPSTPFGLSGIGQPYEDMHVHLLQTDAPSRELRHSLQNREPTHHSPVDPIKRYSTPPSVPSRSPNRQSGSGSGEAYTGTNSYNTTMTTGGTTSAAYASTAETSSTEGSTSNDDWRYNKAITNPAFAHVPPWEQRQHRYSNSPTSSTDTYNLAAPPPIPWEENQSKYQPPAHSPRHSRDGAWNSGGNSGSAGYVEGARRNSRSPATSINGQPRRLRFSDLHADPDPYDGYRYSQGVGEAL